MGPTLYALPPVAAGERARAAAVVARLTPFVRHGALAAIDVHVATTLARASGEWTPDTILAAALAVRAPRFGHICLDVEAPWPGLDALDGAPRPAWPARPQLCALLARSAMVGAPDAPRDAPFVFDGLRLYTHRLWRAQEQVAAALVERMASAPEAPRAPALLASGLQALFPGASTGLAREERLDRQQLAAGLAALRPLLVITGGPGMGKTWTVRNVLALAYAEDAAARAADPSKPPLAVALAAPTGKAAARVRESIVQGLDGAFRESARAAFGASVSADALCAWIEALEARTLHRLLGLRPGPLTSPRYDARRPLPFDLVIVDETSMVDFGLFAMLLDALPPKARLVLLGDRHQLASVEAGSVLADLCGPVTADRVCLGLASVQALADHAGLAVRESVEAPPGARAPKERAPSRSSKSTKARKAPAAAPAAPPPGPWDSVVQLDRTYRFGAESPIGRFVAACLARGFDADLAAGELTETLIDPGEGPGLPEDLVERAATGYARAVALAQSGWDRARDPIEAVHLRRVLDAYGAFRVLCAHRRGPLGVEGLNHAIVERLASPERSLVPGLAARPDPREEYWVGRPILVTRNDSSVRRFNGDVGVVLLREAPNGHRERVVCFAGPDALPQEPLDAESASRLRLVEVLSPARLPPHETTFAMTIHKSQGSEYDRVLVVLPREPGPLLTRELVYTAVTRARREVAVVARRSLLAAALRVTVQRASGLRELVWGASP